MRNLYFTFLFSTSCLLTMVGVTGCQPAPSSEANETATIQARDPDAPLVTAIYTADPSAHVFDGKLYVYPSHDIESTVPEDDLGSHFDMKDYHVLSLDQVGGEVIDHGAAIHIDEVPWASRQMWAPDAAFRDGTYYLYFPAKDQEDIFRIGVATSDSPKGPFAPQAEPITGSYSIDPAIYPDTDGNYYLYFGGIWGGQLQRWQTGTYDPSVGQEPEPEALAIGPQIARITPDMLEFDEPVREIQILDENGAPLLAGDHDRRFFEAPWIHKIGTTYYLSYSTGDTHFIAYATGDNPYGPFTYQGIILHPVVGWTNHHSIVAYQGKWYLFYHDSKLSGGKTHLRSVKVMELTHLPDGSIEPVFPYAKE